MVKKVLIIPSWYPTKQRPVNGSFFKEQAEAIRRRNIKVEVFYLDIKNRGVLIKKPWLVIPSFSIHTIDRIRTICFQWVWPFKKDKYQSFLENIIGIGLVLLCVISKPDIIHIHSIVRAGFVGSFLSKIFKCPYVVTEHSSGFLRYKYSKDQLRKISRVISSSYKTIAVSDFLRLAIYNTTECNFKKLAIIPNMVNPIFSTFNTQKPTTNEFIFSTIASLRPVKGLEILIHAFSQLCKSNQRVKLFVVGEGSLKKSLEKLSFELGLYKKITFMGLLSRSGVLKQLSLSNAFVSSSYVETFGVSIIEALAMGLPVVSTRSGGPESIINKTNGVLVNVGDINDLANGMKYIVDHYQIYSCKKIQHDCLERFSEKLIIDRTITLYNLARHITP